MGQLIVGFAVLIFGLTVGGVGLASAGVGIGLPVIPIGIYLVYRAWRIIRHAKHKSAVPNSEEHLIPLEDTCVGRCSIGIIMILTALSTSLGEVAMLIAAVGLLFILSAFKQPIVSVLKRKLRQFFMDVTKGQQGDI